MDSSVVDGGTSTIGSCTGGSLSGGVYVQLYKAYETCSKSLHVLPPDSKIGVVNDGGFVRSEIYRVHASLRNKSSE